MRSGTKSAGFAALFPLALAAGLSHALPAGAQQESVLYSFGGKHGSAPERGVVADAAGDLFGTTFFGGKYGNGTVFELKPESTGYNQITLYEFTGGADGSRPNGGLAIAKDGSLYGVTLFGGANGAGVVFRLLPRTKGFREKVLYSFTGTTDGGQPVGTPLLGGGGSIIGATTVGGALGEGAVFVLTPTKPGYTESVAFSFPGSNNAGYAPQAGLVMNKHGSLFGTTSKGGGGSGCLTAGCGAVYELVNRGGTYNEKTVYVFAGGTVDGSTPLSPVVLDNATGNIYGTTELGGTKNNGTIFMLAPPSSGNKHYTESILYSFSGSADGSGPVGSMLWSNGNLYGTTTQGGSGCTLTGCGTVFELTPGSGNAPTTLYSFAGPPDGAEPQFTSLIMDSSGALYGTTHSGGARTTCTNGGTADGCGTIFKLVPKDRHR